MIDCIETLPDAIFDCEDPSRVGVELGCPREGNALSICETKQTASWPSVCSYWARYCASASADAGGSSLEDLFRSCLPNPAAAICFEDQQVLVECLVAQNLSCDALPAENAGCAKEKLTADSCHPLQRPLCTEWADACGGLDVGPDGSPLGDGPHSFASCMAARSVETGLRCKRERDVLYECAWNTPGNRRRCEIVPFSAPECEAENTAFMACVRALDHGALPR